jgi:DNA transformation protein
LQSGSRPHFIAYYALVMGLQGRSWNDLDDTEKAALRVRFDALKAQVNTLSAPAGIEAVLDKIGVGTSRDK